MDSNKDTVAMLKKQGVTFIKGDQITNGSIYCVVGEDVSEHTANCTFQYDHFYVKSLVIPRGNTGDPLIKDESDEGVNGRLNVGDVVVSNKHGGELIILAVYFDIFSNELKAVCEGATFIYPSVSFSLLSKPLTPDQLAEKEREDHITKVRDLVGYSDGYSYELIGKLYDLGVLK